MISKFNDIAKKVKSYNTISFKATFIAIALLFLFLSSSYAGSVSKGLKLIYRGEFEKAEALLLKDFDSLNCPANFALAKLYFDKRNPKFNYYEAYKYVELSIHYKDNNSKLKEYDINIDTIERLQNNIDNFAYQDALKQNSIEVYLKYTRQFKDNENLTECLNNLNDLAYKQAIQKNTIKDYNYFLTNFLDANQGLVNDVLDRIARLEMLDCVEKKSIYCLKTFRKAHKANWCFFEATNAIDRIQLDSCYQNKDLRSLEWFLKNSPESKFIDEATNKYEGMFYTSIITKNNMDSFEMFLDKFPFSSRFKEIEDTIYNKYTNYGQDSIKLKEFFDFYPSNVNIPMAQKKYYSIFTNNGKDTLKISQYLSKNPTIFFKDDVELDYYLASTLNEQSLLDLSKYIKSHPNTTYTGRAINKHFYLFSNKYIKTDSLTYYSINYPFITNVLSLYKIIKNKIIDDCYPNLAYYFLENYPNDTSIGNIWNRLINCNSETADVRNNKLKEILERDINKFKTEELVQLKSFLKSDNNTKSKDSNAVAHNNQEPIREQSTKSEPNNDVQTKPEPNKEVLTKVDQTKEEPMTNSITKVESRPQKQITSQERIKNFNDSIIHLIHHAQPELINKNNPNDTIIGIGFIDLENTKMTLTYKFLEFFEKYPIYLDGKQLKFKIQNNSIKTLLFFKGKVNHNKIYVSGSSDLFYTVSDLKIWYKGQLQKEHFMDSFTVSPNKSETDYMTNHNMDQFPTYDGGMLYLDKTLANLKTYICSIIKANCPAAVLKIKSEYEEREKGDIKELTNLLPSSCESTLPKLPSTVHPFTNLNNNVSRKDSKANAFLTFNNHLFAIGSTRSGQKVRYNFNKYFDDEYVGVQSKEFKKLESDDVPFNFRDVMNKFAIPKIKKPGSAELYLLFAEDLLLVGDTEAAEVAYYSTLNIAGRLQTSIPNKCIIKQAAYRGLAEIAEKKNRPLTAELFRLAETLIEDYLSSPNADIDNNAFFSPLEDLQSKCYDVQIEIQRLKAQRTANLINGIAGAAMSVTAAAAGDQSSFEIISNQTLNSLKDGWQQIGFIQQEIQAQDNFFKDVPLTTMEESALLNDLEFNKTFIDVEVGYFCAKYKDSGFPFDIFHNFFKDKIQLKNMVYDANGKIIITTDDQITSLMSQISKLEATARKLEGRGIQINKKAL